MCRDEGSWLVPTDAFLAVFVGNWSNTHAPDLPSIHEIMLPRMAPQDGSHVLLQDAPCEGLCYEL